MALSCIYAAPNACQCSHGNIPLQEHGLADYFTSHWVSRLARWSPLELHEVHDQDYEQAEQPKNDAAAQHISSSSSTVTPGLDCSPGVLMQQSGVAMLEDFPASAPIPSNFNQTAEAADSDPLYTACTSAAPAPSHSADTSPAASSELLAGAADTHDATQADGSFVHDSVTTSTTSSSSNEFPSTYPLSSFWDAEPDTSSSSSSDSPSTYPLSSFWDAEPDTSSSSGLFVGSLSSLSTRGILLPHGKTEPLLGFDRRQVRGKSTLVTLPLPMMGLQIQVLMVKVKNKWEKGRLLKLTLLS
jgi:hypothetical protein